MITSEVYFFICVLIGALVRTFLPYLQKKAEADKASEPFTFEPRYLWTALLAIVTAFIEAMALTAADPYILVDLPIRFAIIAGFFFGLGNNELWNRILGGKIAVLSNST